jgi:Predicted permeases
MFQHFVEYLNTADIFSIEIISILIIVGFIVGFINTIAGMATAITYALFMAMGMPINIANGTTRVGVLSQFLVSSLIFKKKGYLDINIGIRVGIPVSIGALIGAEFVAILDPKIIETIMGIILPIVTILLFVNRKGDNHTSESNLNTTPFTWWKYLIFIFIGMYGGFTHAGVGLLIIFGSFFMLGMDMLHANAIKQFAVLIYTPIALLVFIYHGQINWPVAIIYAIGNILGGVAGSYASIKGGAKLIKIFVASAVLIMSIWFVIKNI